MIYAFIESANNRELVEFDSARQLAEYNSINEGSGIVARACGADVARNWVRKGWKHSTGLWLDNGKLRYAAADTEGY